MQMYQLCIDMEGFVRMIRTLKLGWGGVLAQRQSTCLRSPTLGSHKKKKKKDNRRLVLKSHLSQSQLKPTGHRANVI